LKYKLQLPIFLLFLADSFCTITLWFQKENE
jgi:hypothetical protein